MADGGFLERALGAARARVKLSESRVPLGDLEARCAGTGAPPSFASALRREEGEGIRIIAEIKPASPSAGALAGGSSVEELALAYTLGGAAAISVLTDPDFFSGALDHLERAGRVTFLPLLRKDFIVSPYQVLEARSSGASSVLLLAAALEEKRLRDLISLCRELSMEPLAEVHDRAELERALGADALVVGVNNRDLRTLEVDPDTTSRLKTYIPPGRIVVGASGYSSRSEAVRAEESGVDALLVGEALMRAPDPAAALRAMRGLPLTAAGPVSVERGGI